LVPIGWSVRFLRDLRSLRLSRTFLRALMRCVLCVGWKPRFRHRVNNFLRSDSLVLCVYCLLFSVYIVIICWRGYGAWFGVYL